jgi:hypothetical protein
MLPDGRDGVDESVAAIFFGGVSARDPCCLAFPAGPDMVDEPAGWTTTHKESQAGALLVLTVFVRTRHG